MLYYLHTCSVEGSALLCIHCFTSCFPSKNNCTRALSSTKPSVRCMALATCFKKLHAEKGAAKGLGPGRDRDEVNIILAQQSRLFQTVQQLIAATTLACCIELHIVSGVDVNSTFLTVYSLMSNSWGLASYILTRRTMMQSLELSTLINIAYPIILLLQLTWFQAL